MEGTQFYVSVPSNVQISVVFLFNYRKNSKVQRRGKINLIGRLQLTTERMREEENEGIVQLRILRTQVWSSQPEGTACLPSDMQHHLLCINVTVFHFPLLTLNRHQWFCLYNLTFHNGIHLCFNTLFFLLLLLSSLFPLFTWLFTFPTSRRP